MQFEVLATDGRKVQVDAVDWMMAMAQAMPILGIEVSGWLCNTRPDGTVDVMDPMTGASWKVTKRGADAPAGAARAGSAPGPRAPAAGGPPPVPAGLGAPPPAFAGKTVKPTTAETPVMPKRAGSAPPAEARSPLAPPAPAPAPAPVAEAPAPRPVPRKATPPPPEAPAGPKRASLTERPGQITEMWSRASMNFDDEDDDESEEIAKSAERQPSMPPPDDLAERLFDLSTDLYMAENATAACRMALDILLQLVPSEAGSVLRGKREEGMLTFVATAGPAAKKLLGQKMHFGQGVVGASFDLGITILVQDVSKDARHLAKFDQQTGFQTKSVLCVPLRHQYTIFGAVELINPVGGRFAPWHVEAMETVARTVAQLLAGNR